MDKKQLQKGVLEARYDRQQWVDVLQTWFGVRQLSQMPQRIERDTQDWKKYVKSAFGLGRLITDNGNREVGVFEVQLTSNPEIKRNRVKLRGLLNDIYKDVDGALIVFIQGDKWRFSYVSEIRVRGEDDTVIIQKTEPKRFTYLFGEGENCRTAANRFEILRNKPITLTDLNEAFSVEKLNKEFFTSYKTFFEDFSKSLADSPEYRLLFLDSKDKLKDGWKDENAKPIRDFTKILLGRLVFLQFLQKKSWMGVPEREIGWNHGDPKFLQNLFADFSDKKHFHSTALKTLFFETLNKKRVRDLAPSILGSDIKIPYLNGGLFDQDKSADNSIDFPAALFYELLGFFEQYNFTIDESDPYDREVGIDPEMLGHIFENLLEENREKGAFYTPKEIVHYMCQQSLIEYLSAHLPDDSRTEIEMLVRENWVSPVFSQYEKANEINDFLKKLKICDPAIGSGAFPMGLLKEIFECRRILYGYLRSNEPFSPAEIKKEIIHNNIYGVDIENGAVEIARLRFWLTLVVDEIEPSTLPNLDYKIMQGNSLLERFHDIDLSKLVSVNTSEKGQISQTQQLDFSEGPAFITQPIFDLETKERLHDLIDQYFDPEEYERRTKIQIDKLKLRQHIEQIVDKKIHQYLLEQREVLENEIQKKEELWKIGGVTNFDLLDHRTKGFKIYLVSKKLLKELTDTEKRLIELQHTYQKPYFLWHLWFRDILDAEGFDIFIGNPPYGARLTLDEKDIFKLLYCDVHMRTPDTFNYFISLSFKLLKKSGILSFIVPNNLLFQNENEKTRDLLVNKKQLIDVINLGDNTFENADVPTCIFIAVNHSRVGYSFTYKDFRKDNVRNIEWNKAQSKYQSQTMNEIPGLVFGVSAADLKILKQIESHSWLIDEIADEVASGISTGADKVFRLPLFEANRLGLEEDLLHPVLVGGEIDRYRIKNTDHVLIYSTKRADVPSHLNTFEYLKPFEEKLSQKRETRKGILPWWCLHWSRYKELFVGEKIILRQTSDHLRATIDLNDYFVLNSILVVKFKPEVELSPKYALAVLNSKLSNFIYKNLTQEEYRAFAEVKPKNVRKLYIPRIPKEQQRIFEHLVDYLLFLGNDSNPNLSSLVPNTHISKMFDEILDGCIFELCFGEHMRERQIDILRYVNETLRPIKDLNGNEQIAGVIYEVFQRLRRSDNPIRTRIQLFVPSSPDILKPIIQS